MAKHGEKKHIKRLAASKHIPINDRKAYTWITKPKPGSHPTKDAIPAGVLIRDILHLADTLKDARKILVNGYFLVNGKKIKDEKFGIGLMDIIEFPKISKKYLIVINQHNQLIPIPINNLSVNYGRVVRKYTLPKNINAVTLHNGYNLRNVNNAKIGDTIVYSPKDKKLLSIINLKENTKCMIIDGKHAGKLVVLNKIVKSGQNKRKEVHLKDAKTGEEFITVFDYLLPVDDNLVSEIKSAMNW